MKDHITAQQIEQALGLTHVSLTVTDAGEITFTANEPVTAAMQRQVQAWHDAGAVPDADTRAWLLFLDGVITDPVTGIALKANRNARNDFIGQATLIREALDAGAITAASPMPIWDAENNEHALTVAELRGLLLRYGIAWQTAFNQLAP
jgi:hypothetical protein